MKRNRRTSVYFPVFNNYRVRIILSRDVAATGKRLNIDLNGCEAALVTDTETGHKCAWLVLPLKPDEGTISHEASHAIRQLFRAKGVRVDEECYAYHLDYLVHKIHRFIEGK